MIVEYNHETLDLSGFVDTVGCLASFSFPYRPTEQASEERWEQKKSFLTSLVEPYMILNDISVERVDGSDCPPFATISGIMLVYSGEELANHLSPEGRHYISNHPTMRGLMEKNRATEMLIDCGRFIAHLFGTAMVERTVQKTAPPQEK